MATTGWLGEQTVHEWGGWGTRFTTNVYISGIKRYSDHVDVSGTIYLYCKSNGAYSVWYDWNITSWSMGNNLGQIKERTYTNNILNRSWGKNFIVRINCSNSATSATFNAGFSDANMGGKDKYWTIYFDKYATAPSGIKCNATYTQYSTITTSCSNINWGQGYSSRKLTCNASYTYNGKTENFTLGTWTDGATSKSVTKSNFNFPADLNVSIKWVATTDIGSTTATTQVKVGQTYPAPNLSNVSFTGSSPSTYRLNVTVTGINYGENYSKRVANLYFDYTLDGISYSTLLSSISNGSTSMTVNYNATTKSEPWKFIPDDEKGVLRLVVDNGHQTSTKSSGQIYCQPQYEAYIIEGLGQPNVAEGNPILINTGSDNARVTDFKFNFKIIQDGEPSPLSPKPIQYSAGNQTVSVNGTTYTVNLSSEITGKLGGLEGFEDCIEKEGNNWVLRKNTFDAGLGFSSATLVSNHVFVMSVGLYSSFTPLMACSHFKFRNILSSYETLLQNGEFAIKLYDGQPGRTDMYFRFDEVDSVEELQAWASQAGTVTIYYRPYLPGKVTFSNSSLISTLNELNSKVLNVGQNTISNSAENLPGDMQITWRKTGLVTPATLYTNGKNRTGQFKQIRRIGTR